MSPEIDRRHGERNLDERREERLSAEVELADRPARRRARTTTFAGTTTAAVRGEAQAASASGSTSARK